MLNTVGTHNVHTPQNPLARFAPLRHATFEPGTPTRRLNLHREPLCTTGSTRGATRDTAVRIASCKVCYLVSKSRFVSSFLFRPLVTNLDFLAFLVSSLHIPFHSMPFPFPFPSHLFSSRLLFNSLVGISEKRGSLQCSPSFVFCIPFS